MRKGGCHPQKGLVIKTGRANSILKIFNSEKFRNYSIFSPAFYLIMWLMKLSKNFGKIAILKK